jgi:hypothetical protein
MTCESRDREDAGSIPVGQTMKKVREYINEKGEHIVVLDLSKELRKMLKKYDGFLKELSKI